MNVGVYENAQLMAVIIFLMDFGRRYANQAVACLVLNVYQVLIDIHPTLSLKLTKMSIFNH